MSVVGTSGINRFTHPEEYAGDELLNALRRKRAMYEPDRDDDEEHGNALPDDLLAFEDLDDPEPDTERVTDAVSRDALKFERYLQHHDADDSVVATVAAAVVAEPLPQAAPAIPVPTPVSETAPAAVVPEPLPQAALAIPVPMPVSEPAPAAVVPEPLPQAALAIPVPMPVSETAPAAVVPEPLPQAALAIPVPMPVSEPAPAAVVPEPLPQAAPAIPVPMPVAEPVLEAPAPIASPAAPPITIESAPRAPDAGRKQRPLPSWVVLLVLGWAVAVTWFTVSRESLVSPTEKSASSAPARQQAARPVIAPVASTRAVTPQPPVAPRPVAPARPPVVGFVTGGKIMVPESKRFVTIKVRSVGKLREPLQLSVTAVSGTARVNEDFVPPVAHLTLTRERPSADVLVSLLSDTVRENVEDFSIVLELMQGRATLGTSRIVVALTDDD